MFCEKRYTGRIIHDKTKTWCTIAKRRTFAELVTRKMRRSAILGASCITAFYGITSCKKNLQDFVVMAAEYPMRVFDKIKELV